jgi:hypothetical protein
MISADNDSGVWTCGNKVVWLLTAQHQTQIPQRNDSGTSTCRSEHFCDMPYGGLPLDDVRTGRERPQEKACEKLPPGTQGELDDLASCSSDQLQICTAGASGADCQHRQFGLELLLELLEQLLDG